MAHQARTALCAAVSEGNVLGMMRIFKETDSDDLSVNSFIGDYVKGSGQFLEPTALTVACEHRQLECARKLLELGGKLYSTGTTEDEDDDELTDMSIYVSEDYYGALVIAASKGFDEIIHLLTEFRLFEVPQLLLIDTFAEFVKAAKDGDFQNIQALFDLINNKGVFLKGWKGHNVMNIFLLHGCPPSCVQTMIDNGIAVNGWDYNGFTPLMCAILGRNFECVQYLLEQGADPYAIHIFRRLSFQEDGTIKYINDVGVEMILESCFKKDWSAFHNDHVGPTALMYAAAIGNIPILKLMLEVAPKDIGSVGRFDRFRRIGPLMFAIDYSNLETVSLILQFEAARLDVGESPLCHAICDGHEELFEVLLDSKIEWSDWIYGLAILKCVQKKNAGFLSNVLSFILENVFEIDDGRALFIAIEDDVRDCIDIFIKRPEFSVDMKCTNKYFHSAYGLTCFMFACRKGRLELAKMFLDMGAKVDAVNDFGKTAVMCAALENQVKIFEFLMDLADFYVKDDIGGTVFSAALMGDGSCLEMLIKTGKIFGEKGLLQIHEQSVQVFGANGRRDGFGGYKKPLPIHNILLLIQNNVFLWDWAPKVDRKSLYNIFFAAVTAGIAQERICSQETIYYTPPLFYAFMLKDVAVVRYLLANHYFTREDYRFFTQDFDVFANAFGDMRDYPDLAFIFGKIVFQPQSLKTLCGFEILRRVVSNLSAIGDRNARLDSLPLPECLKDILKSKTRFSQLCPRYWKRLGPRLPENKEARFQDIVVKGKILRNPTLEACSLAFCQCGGLGFALKDVDCDDSDDDIEVDSEDSFDSWSGGGDIVEPEDEEDDEDYDEDD